MTSIKQFFARYEEGANSFDVELVTSHFASSFMGADPNGVACLQNDENFHRAIPARRKFFKDIGFKMARVLDVAETVLDENYTMAKVHWLMTFEKTPGNLQEFRFFITYFLFIGDQSPKIVFYISHDDEQKVMREAGLLPPSSLDR